jgi:hypothetical protein
MRSTGSFRRGHDPRRGRGPRKGTANAGRPPLAWRQALRELADRPAILRHLQEALDVGPAHSDGFWEALKYCTLNGYGRPVQPVSGPHGESPLEAPVQVWRFGDREIRF